MNTGFPNPIEPKFAKKIESPWNFDCPPYDERSSNYVNAGWHHGVGKTNPVGHAGDAKQRVPSLPYGRPTTMKVDEVPVKNLRLDIQI